MLASSLMLTLRYAQGQPAAVRIRSRRIRRTKVGSSTPPIPQKHKTPTRGVCVSGGEGGIRTHGTASRTPDFKSGAFDHSATSPNFNLLTRDRLKLYYVELIRPWRLAFTSKSGVLFVSSLGLTLASLGARPSAVQVRSRRTCDHSTTSPNLVVIPAKAGTQRLRSAERHRVDSRHPWHSPLRAASGVRRLQSCKRSRIAATRRPE